MKHISVLFILVAFLFTINGKVIAQEVILPSPTAIAPYPLTITLNKTTSLIFPFSIKSVDRGSSDILVQKAREVDNILLVKASRENFSQTNLSVMTTDGRFYSFVVDYSPHPSVLNLSFIKSPPYPSFLVGSQTNEALLQERAARIATIKRTLYGVKHKQHEMLFQLNGLYIKDDVLFFLLAIKNASNISYNIDRLRFFIKDAKRYRRTASQEIELKPLYIYKGTATVKSGSKHILVVTLPKFTLPDQKNLIIQLLEKNGNRNLKLNIRNPTLLKAKQFQLN